ncbi:MAG: [Fe-S]-binding protein, partial [Ferruginibacter sp.]
MSETSETFIAKSTIKATDLEHRRKINFNIGRYNAVVPQGKTQFVDVNFAREKAKNIKWRAIETLDEQLDQFEKVFTARGGKVLWAQDDKEAIAQI